MEEEPNEPRRIGVESERVDTVHVLVDVSGENGDEERGNHQTHDTLVAREKDQRQSEQNFDDPRCDDHEIGVEW